VEGLEEGDLLVKKKLLTTLAHRKGTSGVVKRKAKEGEILAEEETGRQ